MEGREERKEQAGKTWRDGKVEREEQEGKGERGNVSADTAVSLFQGSLRSPLAPLTRLGCKTWLQLQSKAVAKGNVRETVRFPDGKEGEHRQVEAKSWEGAYKYWIFKQGAD